MQRWWAAGRKAVSFGRAQDGRVDEKHRGRKGHPPGPLEQESGHLHAPPAPCLWSIRRVRICVPSLQELGHLLLFLRLSLSFLDPSPFLTQFMGSQRVGHDWVTNTFTFKAFFLKDFPTNYMYWLKNTVHYVKLQIISLKVKICKSVF